MARRKKTLSYASPPLQSPVGQLVARRWILLAAAILFLLVFFACVGASWAGGLYRLFTDGVLLILWLAAATGIGAWLLKPFRQPGLVTATALGIGAMSLITLGLGLAGALNRATAWGLIVIGLAAAGLALRQSSFKPDAIAAKLREQVPLADWLWLLIVPFFAMAVAGAFVPPGILWGSDEPNGYDVVEYHLQVPREWFQLGRIVPLHHNVFSFFPFNIELHYLLAMHLRGGPWAGMYLAQLMHLAMVALSVAAIYRFVGRRGLPAVLLAAATPWLTQLGSIAYNEGGVLLFGTMAIGWTLKAIEDSPQRGRLMSLAGVFAGLACGVKLTAVPMLLVLVPVAFFVAMLMRREGSASFKPIAMFILAGLLVFSPWLVRNFLWAHNPVFPEAMPLLGHGHFSPEQVTRWQLAYVPPPGERDLGHRLRATWDQILWDWRFGRVLFPAIALAVAGAVRKRGGLTPGLVLPLLLLGTWLVFWIGFTHLQGRFYVLAIPVAAFAIARIEQPIARLTITCAMLLQVGFGLLNLADKAVLPFLQPLAAAQVLGTEDFSWLSERIQDADKAKGDVCLIGDAKAFWYQLPTARLHYRTVFDVDVRGRDVIDAWADGCPHGPGEKGFVDLGELERFHRTYYGIPAPPTQ